MPPPEPTSRETPRALLNSDEPVAEIETARGTNPPEPTTSPSVDLEAIQSRYEQFQAVRYERPPDDWEMLLDRFSLLGKVARDVPALLAEVARLQALFAEQHELHELHYIEEAVRAFERYPSNLNRQVLFARLAEVDSARLDATPQPPGDGQTR